MWLGCGFLFLFPQRVFVLCVLFSTRCRIPVLRAGPQMCCRCSHQKHIGGTPRTVPPGVGETTKRSAHGARKHDMDEQQRDLRGEDRGMSSVFGV